MKVVSQISPTVTDARGVSWRRLCNNRTHSGENIVELVIVVLHFTITDS
jgi:hypothetical protein